MPKLTTGLVSVDVLAQKGLNVAFDANACDVRKRKVCTMGERHSGLYRLRVPDQAISAHWHTSLCQQHSRRGNRNLDVFRNKKTAEKKYSKKELLNGRSSNR